MDCFALALLLLSLMSVVLSTVALTAYPLLAVSFVAVNPLTLVEELQADVSFRIHPTAATGGIGAISNIKGSSSALLLLPPKWQASSSATCVDGQTNEGLVIAVVALAAAQTLVMAVLTWFAPSPGSKSAALLERKLPPIERDNKNGATSNTHRQHPSPKAIEDEEEQRATQTLLDAAVRSRFLVATTQRIMLVSCPCVFGIATACAVVMFLARACVEEQFSTFFNSETRRTHYEYTASSTSWPAFLMLSVAVCNVVVGLALLHWTWLDQCGPFTAEGKRERDADNFRDTHRTTVPLQHQHHRQQHTATGAGRRQSVKSSGGNSAPSLPNRATSRERGGGLHSSISFCPLRWKEDV